jgi:hypothetical protein
VERLLEVVFEWLFNGLVPDNSGSKRLFDEHGFDNLGLGGGAQGDQLILFRRPLAPVSLRRDPTWTA